MKERYYYLRDGNRVPRITICLLENEEGQVSRGLAICSDNDNPCKKTGRALALAKARKANGTRSNHPFEFSRMGWKNGINIHDLVENLCESNGLGEHLLEYFYEFDPELTELEKRILG